MSEKTSATVHRTADLRAGDPAVHDLVAQIDEAIDAGDEARVEELSAQLHLLAPNTGAGADT